MFVLVETSYDLHYEGSMARPVCVASTIEPLLLKKAELEDNTVEYDDYVCSVHSRAESFVRYRLKKAGMDEDSDEYWDALDDAMGQIEQLLDKKHPTKTWYEVSYCQYYIAEVPQLD